MKARGWGLMCWFHLDSDILLCISLLRAAVFVFLEIRKAALFQTVIAGVPSMGVPSEEFCFKQKQSVCNAPFSERGNNTHPLVKNEGALPSCSL